MQQARGAKVHNKRHRVARAATNSTETNPHDTANTQNSSMVTPEVANGFSEKALDGRGGQNRKFVWEAAVQKTCFREPVALGASARNDVFRHSAFSYTFRHSRLEAERSAAIRRVHYAGCQKYLKSLQSTAPLKRQFKLSKVPKLVRTFCVCARASRDSKPTVPRNLVRVTYTDTDQPWQPQPREEAPR